MTFLTLPKTISFHKEANFKLWRQHHRDSYLSQVLCGEIWVLVFYSITDLLYDTEQIFSSMILSWCYTHTHNHSGNLKYNDIFHFHLISSEQFHSQEESYHLPWTRFWKYIVLYPGKHVYLPYMFSSHLTYVRKLEYEF